MKRVRFIQFLFTLYFCASIFLPFSAHATQEEISLPPTDVTETIPEPDPPGPEAEEVVPATSNLDYTAPASLLVALDPDEEPSELVLRNQEIVTLRASIAGMSPQARAEDYQETFSRAVSGSEIPEPVIKDIPSYGSSIFIGDIPVLAITYLDIDPLENKPHKQIVTESAAKLSQILAEIREERSFGSMSLAVLSSILVTLALSVIIWLILFLRSQLARLLCRKTASATKLFERIKRLDVQRIDAIVRRATKLIANLLIFLVVISWLAYVLRQFPYTRPWGDDVWYYIFKTLRGFGLGILRSLPNLFTISVIMLIAWFITKLSTPLFRAAASGRIKLPGVYPETAMPTLRIISAVIYLFALAAIFPYLPGSDSPAFKGLAVLIGLMVSLGGSGVTSQAMSGLVLIYSRAYQAGDYVRIGDIEGVVTTLEMQATKIRTNKNEEVTIPNSVALSTPIKNYTRLSGDSGVIVHTEVGIKYSEPWRKVHEQLAKAADLTTGLRKSPAPFIQQTALSDFRVEYQLNAYLEKPEHRLAVLAELRSHIQDTFNEADIDILSPHYVEDPPNPEKPDHDTPISKATEPDIV